MAAWAATASRRRKAPLFTRHVDFREPLFDAIDRPRWVLGRTWGAPKTALRLEPRFDGNLVDRLAAAGHDVEVLVGALFRPHGPRRRRGAAPGRQLAKARTIRARMAGRRECDAARVRFPLLRPRPGIGDDLLEHLHFHDAGHPERADDEAGCALKAEGLGLGFVAGQQIVDRLLVRLKVLDRHVDVDAGFGKKVGDACLR